MDAMFRMKWCMVVSENWLRVLMREEERRGGTKLQLFYIYVSYPNLDHWVKGAGSLHMTKLAPLANGTPPLLND